jgi:hypothetical protein
MPIAGNPGRLADVCITGNLSTTTFCNEGFTNTCNNLANTQCDGYHFQFVTSQATINKGLDYRYYQGPFVISR